MNGRDGLTAAAARAVWRLAAAGLVFDDGDRGVVLQLVEAAVGDHVAGIDAVHLRYAAVGHSRLDAAHVRDVVLNHVHERGLAILLNGR